MQPDHQVLIRAISVAIEEAQAGYTCQLTRLVDGLSTYTLCYGDEPTQEFSSIDEAHEYIRQRNKYLQALAVMTTLYPFIEPPLRNLASLPIGPEIAHDLDLVLYANAGKSITVGDVFAARAFLAAIRQRAQEGK